VSGACEENDSFLCERVYEWTGSETAADWANILLDKPVQILLILILAFVSSWLIRRAIRRGTARIATNQLTMRSSDTTEEAKQVRDRATQRANTISHVLNSVATVAIWSIAVFLVLGELGINLGPLIAGAGIVGVALGFGAQSLVKDFISGIFMVAEDQYGVGDIVDLGEAVGTVERVTLRTTVLRDIYGTVWHVPNGQIERVGNQSQLWAIALVDVGIGYDADVDAASAVLSEAAHSLMDDEEFASMLLEEPRVLGIQALDADAVTLRLSIKTEPAAQFVVQRELNRRIKSALDTAGIEIPFPQRTLWFRNEGGFRNEGEGGAGRDAVSGDPPAEGPFDADSD
jgi:small conductance mechanosensitive channel